MNPEWRDVKKEIDAMLSQSRQLIEAPSLDATRTEFQRGRINALNGLLRHFEPPTIDR